MKLLQRKRYIMTDLGQAMSLHYILERRKDGYAVTVTSHNGETTDSTTAEKLKLNLFSAVRFFRLLIRDEITPAALRDILDSQQGRET